jgi:hypothetical protein
VIGGTQRVLVPKGLNEGSQPRKLSGLEQIQSRIRPVGMV